MKVSIQSILKFAIGVGALAIAGSYFYASAEFAFSVAVGSLLGIANLWVLSRLIGKMMVSESTKATAGLGALFFAKMMFLMGAVALAIISGWVQPLALILGFGVVIFSITFVGGLAAII